MRVAVIVAGVVLGVGSLVVSGLYALIIGFGCNGPDAVVATRRCWALPPLPPEPCPHLR
jgi:hypothetical protein